MTSNLRTLRACLIAGAALAALSFAGGAWATEAAPGDKSAPTNVGGEGADVNNVIVTVERDRAAAAAPVKASISEVQPEAIISEKFIRNFTPETGDYTTVVLFAPSMAGVSSNGGGVGEYNKTSIRGFKDGQFNVTYDGVSFGDTNDPTHHPASYFPVSTIGAAVVDRGPGAAGDIGQANYGGAIHYFSPQVSDTFSVEERLTYGTFNTVDSVTQFQTGKIAQLFGTKIFLDFDERSSDGELSQSSGVAQNQTFKSVTEFGRDIVLTTFLSHNYTHFYQSDAGPGETWAQTLAYGYNFALNTNPLDEHYYKYNFQYKQTDFEYVDLKAPLFWGVNLENQAYTYFYSNKTISVNDVSGLVGGANTSAPGNKTLPSTDIGGYDKGNRYRVFGDIVRLEKELPFGTLKVGGLYETSDTDRHNRLLDLTKGIVDNKYPTLAGVVPVVNNVSNIKTLEYSSWKQYQVFVDFYWRPLDNLLITPGFKYVDFKRTVNGVIENSGIAGFVRGPNVGSNDYTKPLYFLTANYRILPYWSIYGQYATGFLIPSLSTLQVPVVSNNNDPPSLTTNYQAGTVYTRGPVTLDLDVYTIKVTNLQLPDPTGQFYVDVGQARYTGVEGEAAYAFSGGLTAFVNGSLNTAKDVTGKTTITNAPKSTFAAGLLYVAGPIEASVKGKVVGPFIIKAGVPPVEITGYNSLDASLAYSFDRFKIKLQGLNLFDNRAITSFSGKALYSTTDTGLYQFQAGRQLLLTLQARF